jgi:hypothetical protein
MLIRMVRFWRSTYDVLMWLRSGLPVIGFLTEPMHGGGD